MYPPLPLHVQPGRPLSGADPGGRGPWANLGSPRFCRGLPALWHLIHTWYLL